MTEKNRDSKTSIAVLATATTVLGLAFPVLAITVRHAASAIQFALALTCVAALVNSFRWSVWLGMSRGVQLPKVRCPPNPK